MQFNRPGKTNAHRCELDLTPLVDVVFLTLMLFMLFLHFQQVKADERAKLPQDSLARPPAIERERELVLNFGYRRAGGSRLRDAVPMVLINDHPVAAGELGSELDRQKRAWQTQSSGDPLADLTVLIRADSDVPSGLVQELVHVCRENGFARFSLQANSTGQ